VSKDLDDFEYTPKPEYQGKFTVISEADEKAMLLRFFTHIQMVRPAIFVTYNGDSFDWPYIDERCKILGVNLEEQCGIFKNAAGEYGSSYCCHMDCFRWVKRDSYLPAGSQGLKAVTSAKLSYDPLELDPEEMTDLARSDPQTLANYSVSDAVATYYLYMKYVNPFIFSLCNIIPLTPDEVLRKGSGTLCETLLMAEAFKANIAMPNKHTDPKERFYNGHLIESETYIGGHVEALESGVFRSDIPCKFKLIPDALEQLIQDLDRALKFSLEKEGGVTDFSQVLNYAEVKNEIEAKLRDMLENPSRIESPLIYHLDVAAMYPNIILTNRLQPPAIVDESMCAVCDYNKPGKTCQRKMTWSWRGEFYTAKRSEYRMIKNQIESEKFPSPYNPQRMMPFLDMPANEQHRLLTKRLGEYSQKVYKRTRANEVVNKTSIVCQRENSFYVDTVRNFRDRRYDYKALHKQSKKRLEESLAANDPVAIDEWSKLHTLYDSLQIAHKCILNSFYGYVMRKGARWYSMEMAGIVCETGGAIIRLARKLIEQIGRPLELDTDGIWCMLPGCFPENFVFNLASGKKHSFAYPCVMLNHLVHDQFTNHQYQTLTEPGSKKYAVTSENSIFFEIDGPYRAMILPSSTEEGKLLKKRYAVFSEDGKLAELKGFEIKRRGELKMIKIFQSQLFKTFLEGDSLVACYAAVAKVADYWLDVLHTKGAHLTDQELFELISENRSMSKSLEDYGGQKSTSISTARRLAEFLGDEMVKDKGLSCRFIISLKPAGDPVASRAIPTAIFSAEPEIKRHYLRKWCRDLGLNDFDIRSIIDWKYYLERFESVIQKLILIPAAMQHVPNPVPRVTSPDWIRKFVEKMAIGGTSGSAPKKQMKMTELFEKKHLSTVDIEDLGSNQTLPTSPEVKKVRFADTVVDNEKIPTVSEPKVDMLADYGSWLAARKTKWRQIRKSIADPTSAAGNTSAFAWNALRSKEAIMSAIWDVVMIEPSSNDPGTFTMHYLAQGSMRKLQFRRPRKIYVHCREPVVFPSTEAALPLVHYKLPYGSQVSQTAASKIIYEIATNEGDYLANYQQYSSFLCHPNVIGIYEATVPLSFLNLVSLGTRIQLTPEARKSRDSFNTNCQFSHADFAANRVEGSLDTYLSPEQLRFLFVYHMHTDNRHVFFIRASKGAAIGSVIIVDPAGKRHIPNLKALFSNTVGAESEEHGPFDEKTVPEFEVDVVGDINGATKLLRSLTTRIMQQRSEGPIVGLLCSTLSEKHNKTAAYSQLCLGLASADSSDPPLPLVPVPNLLEEASYLPPLDWQRHGLRCAFEQYRKTNGWLKEARQLARYSQLPLGNLPDSTDRFAVISDIFLARELRAKGYLLPHRSDSEFGQDTKDASDLQTAPASDMQRPGAFENVVFELDISGFALNALLRYPAILGPEVTEAVISWTGGMLPILKALVSSWFMDALEGERFALKLTEGFFRWMLPATTTGAASMLLGSARCQVFNAMQVVIRRALSLLAGMTASLIAVPPILLTTSKLVLMTRCRLSMASAQEFVSYFCSQVTQREEFQFLQFWVRNRWICLVWMDQHNFAGIPFDEQNDLTNEVFDAADAFKVPLVQNWRLAQHLPSLYEKPFSALLGRFVREWFKQIIEDTSDTDASSGRLDAQEDANSSAAWLPTTFISDQSVLIDPSEVQDTAESTVSQRSLSFELSQTVLRVVQELSKLVATPPINEADRRLKLQPLASFVHVAPTTEPRHFLLEFVKYLGAIISLHPMLATAAVPSLLKQCFALLGVKEFSDETCFVNPIRALVLKQVACRQCGYVQTLDLVQYGDASASPSSLINCQNSACREGFDAFDLEEALLNHLHWLLSTYQRQDLICSGCRLPTPTMLGKTCPTCPSAPKLVRSQDSSVTATFRIAAQVAKVNRFQTVTEFLSSL